MKPFKKQLAKSTLASLVILSLFLQFIPARQEAQAAGILEKLGDWLGKLTSRINIPNVLLDEQGELKLGAHTLFDCLSKGADGQCVRANPFAHTTLSIGGKTVKSQKALVVPAVIPGCMEKFIDASCKDKLSAEKIECEARIIALNDIPAECVNPNKGELIVPKPFIPEQCEPKIPLESDKGALNEYQKLAQKRACMYLSRLQNAASQEVLAANKIFNSTDPFTECLFIRNCRSNCSLRLGEVSFTVTLLDVAALFVPGGFITVIQKVLNIYKIINEAWKIIDTVKELFDSGVSFVNQIFNVMGQVSSLFESFANSGLKMSDVLIYGGGAVASYFGGKEIKEIGVDRGGNIGWGIKKGGELLMEGDGVVGGAAATMIFNKERATKASNSMQEMLAGFAQNNLKFATAKNEAIKFNLALKNDVENVRGVFKQEQPIDFLFNPESSRKKQITQYLNDFSLVIQSVDAFLSEVVDATKLKDGRPIGDLVPLGGLTEWQNRIDAPNTKYICSQGTLELPLGGGFPPTGNQDLYNCFVPNMVQPISSIWLETFQDYGERTFYLKDYFALTDPKVIKKAIVGCDDLSCFNTSCTARPATCDPDKGALECYGTGGSCLINEKNGFWRGYWENLGKTVGSFENIKTIYYNCKLHRSDYATCLPRLQDMLIRLSGKATVDQALTISEKDAKYKNLYEAYQSNTMKVRHANLRIALSTMYPPLGKLADLDNLVDVLGGRGWSFTYTKANEALIYLREETKREIGEPDEDQAYFGFNVIKQFADSLVISTRQLNESTEEGDKFWIDYFLPVGPLPNNFSVEQRIIQDSPYEGEAAYEDWNEKVKVAEANNPKFGDIKIALELGGSPESPIVVYKIAKANNELEEIKKLAGTIGNIENWNDIANKIIDTIIYGTPKEDFPNANCSIQSCPMDPYITHQLDCYAEHNNNVLRNQCDGGIFQVNIYPNEADYRNYANCCVDEDVNAEGHSCCATNMNCKEGYENNFNFYNNESYYSRCENCKINCANAQCSTCQVDEGVVCGDGVVEGEEQCDDGNTSYLDNCLNDCRNAYCGDSYTRSGVEQCDDGNTQSNDGCSATCEIEAGFTKHACSIVCQSTNNCSTQCIEMSTGMFQNKQACLDSGCEGPPSPCVECPPTFLNPAVSYCHPLCGQNCWYSKPECEDDAGGVTPPPTSQCGNWILEGNEECDDGNTFNGDGCSAYCQNEIAQAYCGNGIVEGAEQCDDGNTFNGDGCSSICRNEVAVAQCGNGITEGTEECDDGNNRNTDDCIRCKYAECGDGYKWSGNEECDDGNTSNGDGCSWLCEAEAKFKCVGTSCQRDDLNGTFTNNYCNNTCINQGHTKYGCSPTTGECVEDPNGQWLTSNCDGNCLVNPPAEACVTCPPTAASNYQTSYCHPNCQGACWFSMQECQNDLPIGKSASPFAWLKNFTKSLFKIPKAFAALTTQYCYPNCNDYSTCNSDKAFCDADYKNNCSCEESNNLNGYDNSCHFEELYREKYQCFATHELIYRDGFTAYDIGKKAIDYFNNPTTRQNLGNALTATAQSLQNVALDLSNSFEKLKEDWEAPLSPFPEKNQESGTALAQINKILSLKRDSEDIINNKILRVEQTIANVLISYNLITDFIKAAEDRGIAVPDTLRQIAKKLYFKDPVTRIESGAIPMIQEVINFSYAKIGPEGIGYAYRCGIGKCAAEPSRTYSCDTGQCSADPANTFLCRLKCFEGNGKTFDELVSFMDVLRNFENASFALGQVDETLPLVEPSLDMEPLQIKPSLSDEISEKGQCCMKGCPEESGNGCTYTISYLDDKKEPVTKSGLPCTSWTTTKCKQQTTLFVGQASGQSNFDKFKTGLLANPLNTLEDNFKVMRGYLDISSGFSVGKLLEDAQDLMGQPALDGVDDGDQEDKYSPKLKGLTEKARQLWEDLIWGNEVAQKTRLACDTVTQVLGGDPDYIARQCRERTSKEVSINLLPLSAGGTNNSYEVIKNNCSLLSKIDLDVLENLKNDPNYITNRTSVLERQRQNIFPASGKTVACPKYFCLNPETGTWGAGMNNVDPYCREVTSLYCNEGDRSQGAIRCDGDNEDYTPNIVWSTALSSGQRRWPPDNKLSWQGAQNACISTQQEIIDLRAMQTMINGLVSGANCPEDVDCSDAGKAIDFLINQCNKLEYQKSFARDCYDFSILQKAFGNDTAINENWKAWSQEQTTESQDIDNARKAIKGFCNIETAGKIIGYEINGARSYKAFNCGGFLGIGENVGVDFTLNTDEAKEARELASKICSQSSSDMRTPLNEVMKVFSVLLGVKSYTSAKNGLSTLYFDAQKMRQRVTDTVALIKGFPDKLKELWGQEDAISKITGDNVDVKPLMCIEGPMTSYAGGGEKALTGPNGGPVCPDVSEQFTQLDTMFSDVRQNFRMVDMLRRRSSATFGIFDEKLKIEIPTPTGGDIDEDLNEVVGPLYDRAELIKEKAQLLWALATAINFANENCTCGKSYCPMVGKIPFCVSGLPTTLAPLKQPFCHLVWTLRYPLGSLAERLKQDIESPFGE